MYTHSILPQAEIFLRDSMKIPIIKIEESYPDEFHLQMKDYNSMLTVNGDSVHITVIISFETSLIDKIVQNFVEILNVSEKEKEELYLDASGEVMNIIVGLASPKYVKKGENATMSPPTKINSIEDIKISKENSVLKAQTYTEFGNMDIVIIENKSL